MTPDSITVESEGIREVNSMLGQMYAVDESVYLSFLGICANGDALDNNGRSRQKEFIDRKRATPYLIQKRSWYKEAEKDAVEDVTITFPYVDTSLSYVVSFVKKIYLGEEIKGMVGLDVVMEDLLRKAVNNENCRYVVFTAEGEIVYDTTPDRKSKKMFFNNIYMKYSIGLHQLMHQNTAGRIGSEAGKYVYFATVVPDKYYCLVD